MLNKFMQGVLLTFVAVQWLWPLSAVAQSDDSQEETTKIEETIWVIDEFSKAAAGTVVEREEMDRTMASDGADLLRGVGGVAIGRMGGHGLEARVRGLGESNLNVLADGAYKHGGCPNRMDPPTSYSAVGGYDRVRIIKGVQTLRYGGGGSGGTVSFERTPPRFAEGERWQMTAEVDHRSFDAEPSFSIDGASAFGSGYLRVLADRHAMDNYQDGDGVEVRSGFRSKNLNVLLGHGRQHGGLVELGAELNLTDDALFAGAGMDSPESRNETLRFKYRRPQSLGRWSNLSADLYHSAVEHVMDNYSLRDLTGADGDASAFDIRYLRRSAVS